MEKVVDSRKQRLPGPNVIAMAVEELVKDQPKDKVLAAIAKETTLPNTDIIQFGNTVFITHISEDLSKSWGRAFNVDTARNFVTNGLRFFTHLQDMGVRRYMSNYEGKVYDSAVDAWIKRADSQEVEGGGTRTSIRKAYEKESNETFVFIIIGSEPLL